MQDCLKRLIEFTVFRKGNYYGNEEVQHEEVQHEEVQHEEVQYEEVQHEED